MTSATQLSTDGISPRELDAKSDELCRMYAKRFGTQRDANDFVMDKYRSGLIKQIGYGLLPVKVVKDARKWKIVLAA